MKKRVIYLVLVVLFVYFILKNINDGKELITLLWHAKWQFVILALLLQVIRYILFSLLYKKAFNVYEIKWKLKDIFPMVFAAQSINLFAPFAPFPGSSVFIQRARKEKIPALNILASMFLITLFDYLALCPLLAISIYLQLINQNLFLYEIVGIFAFLLLILTLFIILFFGILSPKILQGLFWFTETLINKFHFLFKKRNFFIPGWSTSRTIQFVELSKKLISGGQSKRELLSISAAKHAVDITTFFLLFLAFGKAISIPTLFVGYSLMILFLVVTPSPQGVGFVETITPAVFKSMGVKIETATLATLAFRGLNLWLPVLVGFWFLHRAFKNSTHEEK
jgi:uncharacterized protein (TIRG00374 family)